MIPRPQSSVDIRKDGTMIFKDYFWNTNFNFTGMVHGMHDNMDSNQSFWHTISACRTGEKCRSPCLDDPETLPIQK